MILLAILLSLKLVLLSNANGPGSVYIRLISYQNPSGKMDNGNACDSWFLPDQCDLVFSVCLKHKDSENSKYPCNIGSISTLGNVFRNTLRVRFQSTIGFIPNPFNFTLRSVPENLYIQINVTDDDISGQELISLWNRKIQLPIISHDESDSSLGQLILTSPQSELLLKVYGRCATFYYGPGCSRFCKPSASRDTGFYACDRVSGQRHCLTGWTGDNCRQRDLCVLENPCHGGATCVMNDSSANCICPESLTGHFCQTPKRPCDSNKCENGGLCVQIPPKVSGVKTSCFCPRNFTGQYCEKDVNECLFYPCKNEAECVNTFGSYNCICKNNYWGIDCEKPPVFTVKSIDSSFLIKISSARYLHNIIVILLIAAICLICIIGILSFLYFKTRSSLTRSESVGSVYSECHFDEKMTNVKSKEDEELPYTNYYELENQEYEKIVDNFQRQKETLKCYEKESVI